MNSFFFFREVTTRLTYFTEADSQPSLVAADVVAAYYKYKKRKQGKIVTLRIKNLRSGFATKKKKPQKVGTESEAAS